MPQFPSLSSLWHAVHKNEEAGRPELSRMAKIVIEQLFVSVGMFMLQEGPHT